MANTNRWLGVRGNYNYRYGNNETSRPQEIVEASHQLCTKMGMQKFYEWVKENRVLDLNDEQYLTILTKKIESL